MFRHPLFAKQKAAEVIVLTERANDGSYFVAAKEHATHTNDGVVYLDKKHEQDWYKVNESQLAKIK